MKRIAVIGAALLAVAAAVLFFRASDTGPRGTDGEPDAAASDAPGATLARGTIDAKRAAGTAAPGEAIGRVIALGGGPIAGASVRATDMDEGIERAAFGEGAAVATDAEGRFRLRGVAKGGGVLASAEGYLARLAAVDPLGEPLEIALSKPDGRIEGSVRDAKGAAVAGALLEVGDFWKGLGITRSDTEGRFSLPARRPPDDETPWVAVWAAGYAPWSGSAPAFSASAVSHLDVVLEAGLRVTVHVVDAESGSPVLGAIVTQGGSPAGAARTDADGLVTWAAGADVTVVDVEADGYAESSSDVERVEGAAAARVEVRLAPFVAFEGVVFDEAGVPFVGADVIVHQGRRTTSGLGGRFRVDGPPPKSGSSPPAPGRGRPRSHASVSTAGRGSNCASGRRRCSLASWWTRPERRCRSRGSRCRRRQATPCTSRASRSLSSSTSRRASIRRSTTRRDSAWQGFPRGRGPFTRATP